MKEGWEYKKLGEVCEIFGRIGFRGYTREDYVDTIEEGVISLSPSNIINNQLNFTNCTFITWDKYNQSPEIKIYKGDVIFVKTASVGKCAYVSELPHESTINPQFVVFKNITIYNRFLFYELLSSAFQYKVKRITSGTSVPTITQKGLSELVITYPNIDEQKRIVSELDLLSSIIEKKKAQLKEYDQLAQSIFYDMFGDPVTNEKGWEVKKLGEVSESELGKTLNSSKDKGKLYPYLCAVNVLWNKIDTSTLKETRFEETELERYSVKKGDLLVCEGGDIGRAAIWQEEYPIQYQNALHRLRFKGTIIPCFCLMFLQSLKEKGILDTRYGKGVTIKHLVKSALLSIPIPVPPLTLQQQFAEKIEAIEKQKELIKQSIKETETLFNSRMDYYFN